MALTAAQVAAKFDAFNKAHPTGSRVISPCTHNTNANCFDLVDEWSRYLGKGCFKTGGDADDLGRLYDPAKWTWIKNTPTFVPRKGDVLVFRTEHPQGHTAIDRGGSTIHLIYSKDQNYSVRYRITNETHHYTMPTQLLGVLRPR